MLPDHSALFREPAGKAEVFSGETSGSMAVSPANAPGDHAACDAEIARLRARAEAAEAKLAAIEPHRLTFRRALNYAYLHTDSPEAADECREALEALAGTEKELGDA